ncbi:MAG: SMI1/KNR4 family protein [Alphaproteobacteria bacterium]|nr:MAG: SMI1/KNR4 family protein [Alphaproteobacteria bacterium]
MKYEYLMKFRYEPFATPVHKNFLSMPRLIDLKEAEEEIGYQFPSELREFYQSFSGGRIRESKGGNLEDYNTSMILPPKVVATFHNAIIEALDTPPDTPIECDGMYMDDSILDMFEPGDIPFFDIIQGSRYLVLKPNSENPNAVWYMSNNIKIEDSFEKFIWNLYHKSPSYFEKIIEDQFNIQNNLYQ